MQGGSGDLANALFGHRGVSMVNAKNKKIADILTSCSYGVLFSYEDISQIVCGKDFGLTERMLDHLIIKKKKLSPRQIHDALVGRQVFSSNIVRGAAEHVAEDQREIASEVVSSLDEARINLIINVFSGFFVDDLKDMVKSGFAENLPSFDWNNPAKELKGVVKNDSVRRFLGIKLKDVGFERLDRVPDLFAYNLLLGFLDVEVLNQAMEVEKRFRNGNSSLEPYHHYRALVPLLSCDLLSAADKRSLSMLGEKFDVMEYGRFLARLRVRLNLSVLLSVVRTVTEMAVVYLNPSFRQFFQESLFSFIDLLGRDLKTGASQNASPFTYLFKVFSARLNSSDHSLRYLAKLWEANVLKSNPSKVPDENCHVKILKSWAAGTRPRDTSLQGLVSALAADERFGSEWPFLRVKAFEVCNAIYYAFDCLGCPEAYREAVVEVTTSR